MSAVHTCNGLHFGRSIAEFLRALLSAYIHTLRMGHSNKTALASYVQMTTGSSIVVYLIITGAKCGVLKTEVNTWMSLGAAVKTAGQRGAIAVEMFRWQRLQLKG